MGEAKFSACARPTLLYVITAVLAANYIVIPLAALFGSKVQPAILPGDLLTLFGVAIAGYSASRTIEKVAALPGDSQVSVLGLKVSNKQ
jgi:Holin of 3TMs, for gene-transfer release